LGSVRRKNRPLVYFTNKFTLLFAHGSRFRARTDEKHFFFPMAEFLFRIFKKSGFFSLAWIGLLYHI